MGPRAGRAVRRRTDSNRHRPADTDTFRLSTSPCMGMRTLETDEDRLRRAVRRVGPLVEDVKRELGSYGVG